MIANTSLMEFENHSRRALLKRTTAVGAGLTFLGLGTGLTSAKPNECPPGTRLLAKYEFEGCGEPTFEKGEDVINITVPDEFCSEDEVEGFKFDTVDGDTEVADPYGDDDNPETATVFSVKYGPNTDTVEPGFYPEEKRSGTVDFTDRKRAISNAVICQGVYTQIDLVTGDILESICDELYGDRVIGAIDYGSYEGILEEYRDVSGFSIEDDEVVVDYDEEEYDETVSLAVYRAPDPEFNSDGDIDVLDTRCEQVLFSSDTEGVGNQTGQLRAPLPSP
jgi:hypothetical protein